MENDIIRTYVRRATYRLKNRRWLKKKKPYRHLYRFTPQSPKRSYDLTYSKNVRDLMNLKTDPRITELYDKMLETLKNYQELRIMRSEEVNEKWNKAFENLNGAKRP